IPGIREEMAPEPTPVDNWDGTIRFTERRESRIVADSSGAKLWARLDEIGTDRPVFASEDDSVRYSMAEISYERRSGYDWYGDWPRALLEEEYPRWAREHGVASVLDRTAPALAWPAAEWERVAPAEAGMDAALLERARDY